MTVMDIFGVVSDPVRRGLLVAFAAGPCSPTQLAVRFPISQPAISRHIRLLREAGLIVSVDQPGDARVRLYRLRIEPLGEIHQWLDQFWQRRLDDFAGYVEALP
jgi:DNA-binding transcriptional ArsR family regulator